IEITPFNDIVRAPIGGFDIDAPPLVMPVDVPFLPRGVSSPVPDTTVSLADIQASVPVFRRVTVSSGRIELTISNNLPVPIAIVDPIRLRDSQNTVVAVFTFTPSTIGANSVRTASADMAGKTMTGDFSLTDLRCHITGSSTPVPIPAGDILVASLTAVDLKASYAEVAQIPPQFLNSRDTTYLLMEDSTLVRDVYLRNGTVNLLFANGIDMNLMLHLRMNELYMPYGSTWLVFEDSVFLPANGTGSAIIDLSRSRIRSLDGDFVRALTTVSSLGLAGSGGQYITMSDTDAVTITISGTQNYIADSALCVLKPTWVPVDEAVHLNFGDLTTNSTGVLQIPSANLAFRPQVDLGFPLDMEVVFAAKKNAAGDLAYLQLPATQKRLSATTAVLQFDPAEVGQFLSELSGQLPDSLRIIGNILVNPPGVYDPTPAGAKSISRNSSFGGGISLDIPLRLSLSGGMVRDTLVVGDSTGDGTRDFDLNKGPISDLNFGSVYFEVENSLPMQTGIRVTLLGVSRQQLLMVPQSGTPLEFTAGQIDAQGTVTVPARSTAVIVLSGTEVQQFNPAEYLVYELLLDTPQGSSVARFTTSDNLQIRIWSNLSYRVNK
ncbi:MAG: hypothetical protein OEM41_00720, partial [Ignavibacteria bacterium]|nr:hypothetical protein [Ignavibacteria bacterium]